MSLGSISSFGPCSDMRPFAMTTILSAISSMRSWWEMMSMLPFISSYIFSNTAMRLEKLQRSMPASGSSKSESLVPRASMVAISMRLSSPPERLAFTSRFIQSRAHIPTRLRQSQASPTESLRPAASLSRSYTCMPLKRTGCWKAKLMPFLARSVMPSPVMSSPSNSIRPAVGLMMPAMTRASVLLPPPLGPVTATKRSLMVKLMSLSISLVPPSSSAAQDMC